VASFYQVWTDDNYAYAASSDGMTIYEVVSGSEFAYVNYTGGFNTVWANDSYIFVGTSNSGVKYIDKTCISGSVVSPPDLYICLNDLSGLTVYSALTSTNVQYIHGNGSIILVVTNSGVDVVKLNPQSYRSYTTITGVNKCFMTSTGRFYYMSLTKLYVVETCLVDWVSADNEYAVGSGIFAAGITLNDFFITENTASDNISNTIFCATTSGAYVIDESNDNYTIYYVE